jgi:small subunit ribosomal protein S9
MIMAAPEKTEQKEKKMRRKKEEAAPKAPESPQAPKTAAEAAPNEEKKAPEAAVAPPQAPVQAKVVAPHEAKPKAERKKKSKAPPKKATKAFVARGKRKTSIARATVIAGKGIIRINSMDVRSINNPYVRNIMLEPIHYVGPEVNAVDISVNVSGGGRMGQAQAVRTAIANALIGYFDQMDLRPKFIDIDRSLVIEDTRRVETKKYKGPKARARFQKSYR